MSTKHAPELDRLFERAQLWIERARPARARRLLRHYVYQFPVEERFFRLAAKLELDVGNRVEGGRYLWLGGCTSGEDRAAVRLFLDRREAAGLARQVPPRMRRAALESVPESVRPYCYNAPPEPPRTWRDRATYVGTGILFIAILFALFWLGSIGLRSFVEGVFGV